jgi:hypothetical protein
MRWSSHAVLIAALLTSGALSAQPKGEAQQLFDEGHAAYDRGDFALACRKFAQSQKLEPAGGTLMSLADCEERLGQFLAARSHYHAALTLFTAPDERIPFVKKRLAALEKRTPTLTLTLAPTASAGATVELDGYPVLASELGTPVPVDPGKHVVVVSAPDNANRRHDLELAVGDRRVLVVGAGAPLPPKAPVPASPAEGGPTAVPKATPSYTPAFVVGGVSIAIGLVGVALSVRAFTHYQDLAETCATELGGCSESDRNAVRAEALAANVAYGVAGAGGVASLLLVAFAPTSLAEPDDVAVVPSPGGAALRLRF